jgi:hypothetical protein
MLRVALRFANIVSVTLIGYALLVAAYLIPYGWVGALLLLARLCRRRAPTLTGYGSARWATIMDCMHLRQGNGVVIGYMSGKIGRMQGLKALFTHSDGARLFLESCQRRQR